MNEGVRVLIVVTNEQTNEQTNKQTNKTMFVRREGAVLLPYYVVLFSSLHVCILVGVAEHAQACSIAVCPFLLLGHMSVAVCGSALLSLLAALGCVSVAVCPFLLLSAACRLLAVPSCCSLPRVGCCLSLLVALCRVSVAICDSALGRTAGRERRPTRSSLHKTSATA
jgi:hypothetical protein